MRGASREAQLRAIARIQGMYVPRFYDVEYHADGTVAQHHRSNTPEAPDRVLKRIVPVLPTPFTSFLVPNIDTVHNRAPIEIMRGCTRGCRFCHAGMVTRPVRERSVQEVVDAMAEIMDHTGFEEISLLSLSSSDYRDVYELVSAIHDRYAEFWPEHEPAQPAHRDRPVPNCSTSWAIPAAAVSRSRRKRPPNGCATSSTSSCRPNRCWKLRVRVYERGWRTIKFYFMIGHPDETIDDVWAIVDLCKATLREGRKILGNKADGQRRRQHLYPQAAYAVPVGAAGYAGTGAGKTAHP